MKPATESKPNGNLLLIKKSKTRYPVSHSEIIYLKAENNYCRLYLENNKSIILCRTLLSLECELDKKIFYRCHKSYLVNRYFVKEITEEKKKSYLICLLNQVFIPLSRRKICDFQSFLISN